MGYREESEKRRQERHELQDSGKSIHHMVEQPGNFHNARRLTTNKSDKDLVRNSPEKAMKDLEDAHARGIMACDWGCTRKVQSRGCYLHASARWAR